MPVIINSKPIIIYLSSKKLISDHIETELILLRIIASHSPKSVVHDNDTIYIIGEILWQNANSKVLNFGIFIKGHQNSCEFEGDFHSFDKNTKMTETFCQIIRRFPKEFNL